MQPAWSAFGRKRRVANGYSAFCPAFAAAAQPRRARQTLELTGRFEVPARQLPYVTSIGSSAATFVTNYLRATNNFLADAPRSFISAVLLLAKSAPVRARTRPKAPCAGHAETVC